MYVRGKRSGEKEETYYFFDKDEISNGYRFLKIRNEMNVIDFYF